MTADITVLALRRFEAFYERLDAALDSGDVDAISLLVEERTAVVDHLVATHAGIAIPDDVRERLLNAEQALRTRLLAVHDELAQSLAAQRQRGAAAVRYSRGR